MKNLWCLVIVWSNLMYIHMYNSVIACMHIIQTVAMNGVVLVQQLKMCLLLVYHWMTTIKQMNAINNGYYVISNSRVYVCNF